MEELGLVPLVNGVFARFGHSALPDSPVVPDRPPGRLRLLTAGALHRLAARLDGGRLPPLEYSWPQHGHSHVR
jgi:hypothetical protein